MTKSEWINVLDKAIEKARVDYYDSQCDSSNEKEAHMCMSLLSYVRDAMVEVGEKGSCRDTATDGT